MATEYQEVPGLAQAAEAGKIQPVGDFVLVCLEEPPPERKADDNRMPSPAPTVMGEVVAVGSECEIECEEGDHVILASYGDCLEDEGEHFVFARASDIKAIVAGPGTSGRVAKKMMDGEYDEEPRPEAPKKMRVRVQIHAAPEGEA